MPREEAAEPMPEREQKPVRQQRQKQGYEKIRAPADRAVYPFVLIGPGHDENLLPGGGLTAIKVHAAASFVKRFFPFFSEAGPRPPRGFFMSDL